MNEIEYVLQYRRDENWWDSGTYSTASFPQAEALQRATEHLAYARSVEARAIFQAEWRLVTRIETEVVLDPAPEHSLHHECPPVTVLPGQKPHNATALAVQARDGLVEVGWSRYSIEQADELIAAIHRAQLKAAEQR